jgi:hypothetical protein
MRTILSLLTLFVASSALASADLRVTIGQAPARVEREARIPWTVTLENLGPDPAEQVQFDSWMENTTCVSEIIPLLAAGATRQVECAGLATADHRLYYDAIAASARAGSPDDPNPSDNFTVRFVDIATPPDLGVSAYIVPYVDRGLPFTLDLTVDNIARTTATGVTVTVDVPDGVGIGTLPAGCTKAAPQQVVCGIGSIAPRVDPQVAEPRHLLLPLIAPDVAATSVTVTARIEGNELDAAPASNVSAATTMTYRAYEVTTTADAGQGSLRDALETVDADASCSFDRPCKIAFRIAPSEGAGWQTIRPLSPLPALTASGVIVDGTTETRYYGDRNPAGPEIELQGSAISASGNGLDIEAPCSVTVRGLTINGFPDAGLLLGGPPCASPNPRFVEANYIGCDPTGTKAVPNGRGIVVDSPSVWADSIRGNVASGNRRSGIFVLDGKTTITDNLIGLTPAHAPLGNGASGIYIGAVERGAEVAGNLIGFNHDSGLSVAREARYVSAAANSFQGNWQLAIDIGLDGVSPSVAIAGGVAGGTIQVPEITVARYDPASDRTILEGLASASDAIHFDGSVSVELYANDAPDESGYGEGQYPLGSANVDADRHFTFSFPGHLPGPWVAGRTLVWALRGFSTGPAGGLHSTTDYGGDATATSEFGRTVRVAD